MNSSNSNISGCPEPDQENADQTCNDEGLTLVTPARRVSMSHIPQKDSGSLLLRYFRSDFFDASKAIAYLYKSTDSGVRDYICNELFVMSAADVEFFLPQLAKLCIMKGAEDDGIERFIMHHSCRHLNWAVILVWILDSTIQDSETGSAHLDYCISLRNRLLNRRAKFSVQSNLPLPPPSPSLLLRNEKIRMRSWQWNTQSPPASPQIFSNQFTTLKADKPPTPCKPTAPNHLCSNRSLSQTKANLELEPGALENPSMYSHSASELRTRPSISHSISHSESTDTSRDGPLSLDGNTLTCSLLEQVEYAHLMQHGIPSNMPMMFYLEPQMNFTNALVGIGDRLVSLVSKEMRKAQLFAELTIINLNLPARVYLPLMLTRGGLEHHVVRIPPEEAVILNSRDRVPFMVCVEVIMCPSVQSSPLPVQMAKKKENATEDLSIFDSNLEHIKFKVGDGDGDSVERRPSDCSSFEGDKAKSRFKSLQDNSVLKLKELWVEKKERIRKSSPYGAHPDWNIFSIIVKCGDDLRQEVLASQLITQFKQMWVYEKLDLWLRPTGVMAISNRSGTMETIPDTLSIHSIKKQFNCTLPEYFLKEFGDVDSPRYKRAQLNYVRSFAAYSLVCYFLAVKDRHNGNIMLNKDGYIIHIDFGFFLSNSPGNLGFETSPFKLTSEFVDVMGGVDSPMYGYFKELIWKGFIAARKHAENIESLVTMMQEGSRLPCFYMGPACVEALSERFHPGKTEEQLREIVDGMINDSLDSISTKMYDNFQYYSNEIL